MNTLTLNGTPETARAFLGAHISETGLSGLEAVSSTDHQEIGKQLARIEKGTQWALGDWYNTIQWGDKYDACVAANLNYSNAHTQARVAATFPNRRDRAHLPFDSYQILSLDSLTEVQRATLLEQAKASRTTPGAKPWSAARLRRERDLVLGIVPPEIAPDFNTNVDKLTAEVIRVLPAGTSKKAIRKTAGGIKILAENLQHGFSDTVTKLVEQKTKARVEKLRESQEKVIKDREQVIKLQAGGAAFMSKAEYNLVRSVVHPDKSPHPKAAAAFAIISRIGENAPKDWN